jgi:hypothetical protein
LAIAGKYRCSFQGTNCVNFPLAVARRVDGAEVGQGISGKKTITMKGNELNRKSTVNLQPNELQ